MNKIKQIQQLNKRELEAGISTSASWHTEFRDTAYIYIGGLPFELSEGDIVTIFSQFGEPVHINLVRDRETGKSKGFCFLKYDDQRSTDLAVDNLSGAKIMGRMISVDHTRYKRKDDDEIFDNTNGPAEEGRGEPTLSDTSDAESSPERPVLKEERELALLKRDHDDDDPMKGYLVQQKEEEVRVALQIFEKQARKVKERESRHHRRHHRSHRNHSRHHHRQRTRSSSARSSEEDRSVRKGRDHTKSTK